MNRAFLSVVFLCLALSVAFAVDSGFQDYSSGFYTKGLDTAVNFDSGSETYDPYYLPAADWSIAPRLTLTVTWDDNLFLSNENPESAELIDLIPGVMAIYGRPDHNYLYLDAGTIYHVYDSSGNLEDQSDYLVTLGSVYKTGKSTLDGGIGFRRSETADTVIGQRILKDDYSFNLSLGHQLSEKNSGLVGYSASFSSYNDEELNDNQNQQILLRLARKVSDASDVYGQFDAGRDDVDAEGDLGDAEYYGLAIGFTGKQSAKLTLSGDIGYQWRKIIEDDTETVEDVTSSLGINYNPFGFTVIYANFDSTISPAINSLG